MDYVAYVNAFLALIFVLGLIGIVAFIFKKFSHGSFANASGNKKRLSLQEVFYIDAKRKLVLVKRDDVEHLILIGTNSETVVEKNVKPNSYNSGENA